MSSHGQNKHLVGEKIIGVFFVSMTGFPSPAIGFFFFKKKYFSGWPLQFNQGENINMQRMTTLFKSFINIANFKSCKQFNITEGEKNERKQSLSPTDFHAGS